MSDIYSPETVQVTASEGRPVTVAGKRVEWVREEWLVEEGWWSANKLRRHYFELLLADGRNTTVFYDLTGGGWFRQAGA